MYPLLELDLAKIHHNARQLHQLAAAAGISLWGVTKVLCGAPELGETLLAAGITTLADSRLQNLQHLPAASKVLLRLPDPRQAAAVVNWADWSLNSQLPTLQALSRAALEVGKRHRVLLMVDVGDLREGLWPDEVIPLARAVATLPGIEIGGLGTNLTCFGGILPDATNLGILIQLASELRRQGLTACQVVSGGNSSTLKLLQEGKLPSGINNLRLGEAIVLGRETATRRPLPGLYSDTVTLQAVAIEVGEKPSRPIGTRAPDAFGESPHFPDLGQQRRVIVAIGRQDIYPKGLTPLQPGVSIIGASSDHLLLAVTDSQPLEVGQVFSFSLDYGALLAASTSPYVRKRFLPLDQEKI